ncbi:MAG: phosphate acyltransferase PlsX [Chloroflexota bacterium]
MRIVVDAMGGDNAPEAVVKGAVEAAEAYSDINVVLSGDEQRLRALVGTGGSGRIEFVHASQVIETGEPPVQALRRKKDSSLVVAINLVRDGKADAVVTAGSTGAFMAGCLLNLGRLPGIDRPALAAVLPTLTGGSLLIDMGANVDCKPENLLQFAVMGSCYAEAILGVARPRVGLLSVGAEESKGSDLVKAAHGLLREAVGLNFAGNIEARDIPYGAADVVVCDGFAGNVVLKLTEGLASAIFAMLKTELSKSPARKLAAAALRPAFSGLKKKMDYSEHGGAPLLGLKGAAIKCHGSSDARAIRNGVRVARQFVAQGVLTRISDYFAAER